METELVVLLIISQGYKWTRPATEEKNRKYAANSKLAKHAEMPQRLYLRFICAKRRCARGFRNLPHTSVQRFRKRGEKTEICRPDPGFTLPRPAVLLPKIGLRSEVSDFSPALPENTATPIVPKRKPLRIPLEKQPFNAKTAYRRFPRTKPDVPSQGLITVEDLRNNPTPVNHYPDGMTTVELNRKADLRQVKRPPYSASSSILNNTLCIGIKVLHAEAKRLPIKCLIV